MKLLVDAVAFQHRSADAAASLPRIEAVLRALDADDRIELRMLDRGGAPDLGEGRSMPFPPLTVANDARDSIMIQRLCDQVGADAFFSTGHTTPLRTPMLLLWMGDPSPARARDHHERGTALAFARHIGVASAADRDRLLADHAMIDGNTVVVFGGCTQQPAAVPDADEQEATEPGPTEVDLDPATLANAIAGAVTALATQAREGAFDRFFADWERLRRLQADVDLR